MGWMGVVVRCDPTEDQQEASLSLSLLASLSFHCQYIPPLHVARTIHYYTNLYGGQYIYCIHKYMYCIHRYTCVSSTWYCIVKTSKAVNGPRQLWRCVCAVVLSSSQLDGMLQISPRHTGKILPIHSLSSWVNIFRFFGCLFIFDFHLFVNKEHLRYFQDDTDVLPAPWCYFFM